MSTEKKYEIDEDLYRIQLELFEGPLDLLLYLIKRDELDIYDIPISHVAEQFVSYIETAHQLNLNVAGEYLLMASILLRIKIATMLPRKRDFSLDEIEDPREELVNMILEYSRYRKMGEALARRYSSQTKYYPRGHISLSREESELPLEQMSLVGLMQVAWELLKKEDKIGYSPADEEVRVTVEEQTELIIRIAARKKRLRFVELFEGKVTRMVFAVTFFSMLELIRTGQIAVSQEKPFSPIWIFAKKLL